MQSCSVPSEVLCSQMRQQTNTRIYDRNIPGSPLQPYVSVRPVMTKYSYFPIVDPRKEVSVPLVQRPTFDVHSTFNPGNTQSPWSGFACNINTESELRNQIYALQRCSQSVYVPQSSSDLYEYRFTPSTTFSSPDQHSLLFEKPNFQSFNPNPVPATCGAGIFFNSTRCQIKELTTNTCDSNKPNRKV